MEKVESILWQAKMQKKRNWLQVRKLLLDGIKQFPQETALYLELGTLYESKKMFRKAIDIYQKAIEIVNYDYQIFYRIGNCFIAINEFSIAVDYYERIEDPFPEILYNTAYAYSRIGKTEKAILILKKVLEYPVVSQIPYVFIAELYFSQRQYDKVIHYIEIAENKFGKQGTFFYLRGLAFSHQRIWLKTYFEFQQAEKLKFETPVFFRSYGIACEKIGKTEKAVELLLKSIKLAPEDPTNYIELINIYLSHGRILEAARLVKTSQKNVPISFTLSLLKQQIKRRLEVSKKHNK